MSCILIERDVEHYSDYDQKTHSYKTVKTVHEQHLVDLSKAAFTCNSQIGNSIGYTVYSPKNPFRLIRGIILPCRLFHGFEDWILEYYDRDDEILVDSLPEQQRQEIYGLFNEKELYDIWNLLVYRAACSSQTFRFIDNYSHSREYISQLLEKYYQHDVPLMLMRSAPARYEFTEEHGNFYRYLKGPTNEPLLIQPGAFLGISKDLHSACTCYGHAKLLDTKNRFYASEYFYMIKEKLNGFCK